VGEEKAKAEAKAEAEASKSSFPRRREPSDFALKK
jgi:hypothetical protein